MRQDLSRSVTDDTQRWLEIDLAHLWHPYTQMAEYTSDALLIVRAAGTRVWDSDGKEYLDGMSGLWNVNLGHNRPEIEAAVVNQLRRLDYFPLNGFSHMSAINLAAGLVSVAPPNLTRVFFCTGGSEAAESAIKISRRYWRLLGYPNRYRVISLQRGWHGGTLGALSAAGIPEERQGFGPFVEGFFHTSSSPYSYRCTSDPRCPPCSLRCVEGLEELILKVGPETVCAVVIECVQGAGGIIPLPFDYVRRVRQITRELGCHLVVDEVATGFGRTGRIFSVEHSRVTPDFLLCSKAITNGSLPLGAILTTDDVYKAFLGTSDTGRELMHGYTFGGHPAACAAAVATLNILVRENLVERARMVGNQLLDRMKQRLQSSRIVGEVRGLGMMLGVEIVADKHSKKPFPRSAGREAAICRQAKTRGLFIRSIGNVIPVMPPLILDPLEVDELVEKLEAAVRVVESETLR